MRESLDKQEVWSKCPTHRDRSSHDNNEKKTKKGHSDLPVKVTVVHHYNRDISAENDWKIIPEGLNQRIKVSIPKYFPH